MAVNQVSMNGEELINLTEDTVSENTLLENVTAHDASGKQITGKFVPYNPNLLDNPDFSINQRGQSVYDGTVAGDYKYTVDRWCFWKYNCDNYGTVTVNSDGSLSVDGTNGLMDCLLTQFMENGDKLIGKTVTLSVEITELTGSLTIGLHTHSEYITAIKPGIYSLTFTWPEISAYKIFVNNVNSSHYTITWMKLELGSVATAFVPPNPAVELAKCQRYLLKLSPYIRYGASRVSSTDVDFFIPTPTTMRTLPTIDLNNIALYYLDGVTVKKAEGFVFAVPFIGSNGFIIRAVKASHGLTWAYIEFTDTTSSAFASAEL